MDRRGNQMEADAMTTRSQLGIFGAAVLLATMMIAPAGAAPISGGALKDVTAADRQIDAVHHRAWRHCHCGAATATAGTTTTTATTIPTITGTPATAFSGFGTATTIITGITTIIITATTGTTTVIMATTATMAVTVITGAIAGGMVAAAKVQAARLGGGSPPTGAFLRWWPMSYAVGGVAVPVCKRAQRALGCLIFRGNLAQVCSDHG
jgi:hypothetical protein